ncbi:hypothetical protein EJ07DRAFT_159492 [Lizonia empirigonia]|nr:hypothetical protein EJ07DRAFT_159492 [Lizonia empirigonia]
MYTALHRMSASPRQQRTDSSVVYENPHGLQGVRSITWYLLQPNILFPSPKYSQLHNHAHTPRASRRTSLTRHQLYLKTMSLHARQPTLLRMVMDPATSPPTTPPKPRPADAAPSSPYTTELEPTPLLLALDMAAERKRLRRTDSVVMSASVESEYVEVDKAEIEGLGEESKECEAGERGDGKEVVVVVKEDLSQLVLLGRSVSNAVWNGVEGVRRGVWGVVGWA